MQTMRQQADEQHRFRKCSAKSVGRPRTVTELEARDLWLWKQCQCLARRITWEFRASDPADRCRLGRKTGLGLIVDFINFMSDEWQPWT
jgi:hypothetical protein